MEGHSVYMVCGGWSRHPVIAVPGVRVRLLPSDLRPAGNEVVPGERNIRLVSGIGVSINRTRRGVRAHRHDEKGKRR
jgi:hypothetical protein